MATELPRPGNLDKHNEEIINMRDIPNVLSLLVALIIARPQSSKRPRTKCLPEHSHCHMIDLSFGTGIFPIHSCTGSVYLLVCLTARMRPEEDSVPGEAVRDQSYTSVKFMVVSFAGHNEEDMIYTSQHRAGSRRPV